MTGGFPCASQPSSDLRRRTARSPRQLRTLGSDATVHGVPALKDLLTQPDDLPIEAVLHAVRPWTPSSDVVVTEGDEAPTGYDYLLEVDAVLSVLEVWSAWREGHIPTPEESAEAVIYYAERDAYLPVS